MEEHMYSTIHDAAFAETYFIQSDYENKYFANLTFHLSSHC